MQKLEPKLNVHLTENVLKYLSQNRIKTVLDFLQQDNEKLVNLTKLNLQEVLSLRTDILKRIAAPIENGASLFSRKMLDRKFISTGIESLDILLDGGIPVECLTEICGLADCGKSQFCFQVAISCVQRSSNCVLYVDTKGDFSAVRVQKVLDSLNFTHKDMALVLYKIKVVYAWTIEELIELFKKLKNKQFQIENLSLIIIDSLPCLMFQHLGDESKIGLSFLNVFVNYSRFLSKHMNLAIICVNIQTRWIEQDASDLDAEDSDISKSVIKEATSTEIRTRCLGKYWHNIPTIVILLEKITCNDTNAELNVTLLKSFTCNKIKKCTLSISNTGVQ